MDVNDLKKKFPAKIKPAKGKSSKAAVRAIQLEYERKKADLTGGAPVLKKGPLFYGMIVLLLIVIGSLVVPQLMRGGITLGKRRIELKDLQARKSMEALSVALGRYKFHVGEYPTTEEGLAVLAYHEPKDVQRIRRKHPGWDGWYVSNKRIPKDPWGNPYVYETRPEGGHPVLYSKGPDGKLGTPDDVLPDQLKFDEPFRNPSWTNEWVRCELRDIVVAPDEETKKRIQEEMRLHDPKSK